jgi:putative membrane protein
MHYARRAVVRFLVRTFILLVANAVGLIVASLVLDDFEINVSGFIIALVIFTLVVMLMQPFLVSQFRRGNNTALLGGVSLVATLVGLIITDLLSDGLEINGLGGWLGGTVIVWAGGVLAAIILPYLGLKKYLEERRD